MLKISSKRAGTSLKISLSSNAMGITAFWLLNIFLSSAMIFSSSIKLKFNIPFASSSIVESLRFPNVAIIIDSI